VIDLMSAAGPTRTFRRSWIKSALHRKADVARCSHHVRLVPITDIEGQDYFVQAV
jgi:hypothetical protein